MKIKSQTVTVSLTLLLLLGLPAHASPLQEAIDSDQTYTVRELLEQGAFDPNIQISWQKMGLKRSEPLIHWAIRQENLELVRSLLEKGVDPNLRDAEANTPLIRAAWGSPTPGFKPMPLPQGSPQFAINWQIRGEGFFSVLNPMTGGRYYIRNGNFQLNKYGQVMTEQGFLLDPAISIPAEVDGNPSRDLSINSEGEVLMPNPTTQKWVALGRISLVRFPNPSELTAVGAGLWRDTPQSGYPEDFPPGPGETGEIEPQSSHIELQKAIVSEQETARRQIRLMGLLIEKGADLNAKNQRGETALSASLQAGQSAAFQFLFEKTALPESEKKIFLEKALYQSVWQSNDELSEYIIKQGAFCPPQLLLGLVLNASRTGKRDLLNKLQAQGVDFKALNTQLVNQFESPIMEAARGNHTDILKFLVDQGMDINYQYHPIDNLEVVSNNAVFSAIASGSYEALQFLLEHKANYRLIDAGIDTLMQEPRNNDTPVSLAARRGDLKSLQLLLNRDSKISEMDLLYALNIATESAQLESMKFLMAQLKQAPDEYIDSLLTFAVMSGQLEILKFIQAKGASLDRVEKSKPGSLLNVAAMTGATKMCEYLLQQKLDPNIQNLDGRSVLQYAARNGKVQLIPLLLAAGAKINQIDKEGNSPLMLAIKYHQPESVKALLEADLDLKIKNQEGKTALDMARASGNQEIFTMLSHAHNLPAVRLGLQDAVDAKNIYLIQEMIYKGSDPNQTVLWKSGEESTEAPLLVWAVSIEHLSLINSLIEHGANLNAQDNAGVSALSWAVWLENMNIVQILLKNKANPNLKNTKGDTPLTFAILKKNLNLVKLLISKGADPKDKDNENDTLLMSAARAGNVEIIKYLISKGADPKITTPDGLNVLNQSLSSGNWDASNYFLKIGLNLKQVDSDGYNNLMWAAQGGNLDLVKLLISKGLDPKTKTKNGWTPLMSAAFYGQLNIVKYLVSLKVDWKVKDKDGKTALDYARDKDKQDVVNWLKTLK
jgi:ankyrin repeat protein